MGNLSDVNLPQMLEMDHLLLIACHPLIEVILVTVSSCHQAIPMCVLASELPGNRSGLLILISPAIMIL